METNEVSANKIIKELSEYPELAPNIKSFSEGIHAISTLASIFQYNNPIIQDNINVADWLLTGKYTNNSSINSLITGYRDFGIAPLIKAIKNYRVAFGQFVNTLSDFLKFGETISPITPVTQYANSITPIQNNTSTPPPQCIKEYKIISTFSSNPDNQVFKVSKDSKEYVMKISSIDSGERDIYFLVLLDGERINGQRITPELIGDWKCEDKIYFVMELYDGDMFNYSVEYAKKFHLPFDYRLYTKEQLLRMFKIAVKLDELQIYHGDLKPDQYLYSVDKGNIVLADFGFSGGRKYEYKPMEGWSGGIEELKCPPGLSYVEPNFKDYPNVKQLEMSIMLYGFPMVHDGGLRTFTGVKGLVRDKALCPGYYETYHEKLKELNLDKYPAYEVDLMELVYPPI